MSNSSLSIQKQVEKRQQELMDLLLKRMICYSYYIANRQYLVLGKTVIKSSLVSLFRKKYLESRSKRGFKTIPLTEGEQKAFLGLVQKGFVENTPGDKFLDEIYQVTASGRKYWEMFLQKGGQQE